MKLAFIATRYGTLGGVETYLHNILPRLAKKHEIKMIARDEGGIIKSLVKTHKNIEIKRVTCLNRKFLRSPTAFPFFLKEAFKLDADIINAQSWSPAFPAIISNKFRKKPLTTTFHNSCTQLAESMRENQKLIPVYRFFEKYSIKNSDKTICVSEHLKKTIEKEYGNSKKIMTIPDGVDTKKFKPAKKPKNDSILFLGRINNQKQPEIFCKAAKLLHEKTDKKFLMVGFGDRAEELRKKYSKYVEFPGRAYGTELVKYFQNARLFVLPTISDGFAITFIESLSCGTPVLGTRMGVFPEIINNNPDFGLELNMPPSPEDLAEKIINELDKPLNYAKRKIIHEKIRKKYDWDVIVKKLENLYETLA